jgi:hypothetical protein
MRECASRSVWFIRRVRIHPGKCGQVVHVSVGDRADIKEFGNMAIASRTTLHGGAFPFETVYPQ